MGARSGFFPSTAGSHYGQRPLKLIISSNQICVLCFLKKQKLIFFFFFIFPSVYNKSMILFFFLKQVVKAAKPLWHYSYSSFAPAILSWGLCGMPFDRLTPNRGSV